MIDLTNENAKRREWQRQLRLAIVLENNFANDVAGVLKRQYKDAAKLIEDYNFNIDQAVDNHQKDLQEEFRSNYKKIATTFNDDIVEDLDKNFLRFETKGLIEEFWHFMNIWILANSASQVTKVNNTTKKLLSRIISKSIDDGDTNRDTAKKIRQVAEISTLTRARTIARTETHTASMRSMNETMRATRQIRQKEWISANDSRTRTKPFNHLGSYPAGPNGERVGIDDYFQGTGEALQHPGDFIGAAGNIINCIASSRTLIFTSVGWRQIRDIKEGDNVLTHKNRFRKVLKTNKRKYRGDVYKIYMKGGMENNKSNKYVMVTDEHPFLTAKGKWIMAKDLKVGDKLKFMASFCARCGKAIPYYKKYCSQSCCSKDITEKQWSNPKHKENMSKKATQQLIREYSEGIRDKNDIVKKARSVCREKYGEGGYLALARNSEDFKEKMLDSVNRKYGSYLNMLKRYAFPALGKTNFAGSKIEDAMAVFLDKNNKEYVRQFVVGRRRVDFYIEKEKLFIEVDGYPFHEDKEKERKRDYEILQKYPDHNIAHVSYKTDPPSWEYWSQYDLMRLNHEGVYDQVDIEIGHIEIKKETKTKDAGRIVYNFSVEEDESYIARGFVVHNCRCGQLYHSNIV